MYTTFMVPPLFYGLVLPFAAMSSVWNLKLQSSPVLNLSLHCDLVLKRELDISGFGVRLTLHFSNPLILEGQDGSRRLNIYCYILRDIRRQHRIETFISRGQQSPEIHVSAILAVQVIQLLRSQISYYNLVILSHMGGLLSIPLLIEATSDPPLIDTGLSVVQFGLNLYLLLVSTQESISSCSWPLWDIPVSASSNSRMLPRPSQWETYVWLLSSLLLDVLVVSALSLSFHDARSESR